MLSENVSCSSARSWSVSSRRTWRSNRSFFLPARRSGALFRRSRALFLVLRAPRRPGRTVPLPREKGLAAELGSATSAGSGAGFSVGPTFGRGGFRGGLRGGFRGRGGFVRGHGEGFRLRGRGEGFRFVRGRGGAATSAVARAGPGFLGRGRSSAAQSGVRALFALLRKRRSAARRTAVRAARSRSGVRLLGGRLFLRGLFA